LITLLITFNALTTNSSFLFSFSLWSCFNFLCVWF